MILEVQLWSPEGLSANDHSSMNQQLSHFTTIHLTTNQVWLREFVHEDVRGDC